MLSKIARTFLAALMLGTASLALTQQASAASRRLEIAPGAFGLPSNEVARDRGCATGCGGS